MAEVIPFKVTNNCHETIWPGIGTQGVNTSHTGPNGFELPPGQTQEFKTTANWQGRIWGRTNCTFNEDGTGPKCGTGDCGGVLDCVLSGEQPLTLAELLLQGDRNLTFYDISLVDGYNLPMAIVHIPSPQTADIPPNVTNVACIGTAGWAAAPARAGLAYSNASFPVAWESRLTNADIARWCPWDLQLHPPYKPGDGVYPYPDDDIERPAFSPCWSACGLWGRPGDCCTGEYAPRDRCGPSYWSQSAKAVCPDAYSYAYDDSTSTFTVPSGGGWEIVFCPAGRSTNILATIRDGGGATLSQVGTADGGGSQRTMVGTVARMPGGPKKNGGSGLGGASLRKTLLVVCGVVTFLSGLSL